MTYDELLEAVNSPTYRQSRTLEHPYIALRAVVELHKPKAESDLNDYLICEECTEISWRSEKWPCHTVKEIEEALQ